MPHEYNRTPFDTTETVRVSNPCHLGGARDLFFNGIQWQRMSIPAGADPLVGNNVLRGNDGRILFEGTGTPVFAVEDGVVVFINRDSTCYDNRVQIVREGRGICAQGHTITLKGRDGYYTEYQHVYAVDNLVVGSIVLEGGRLGNVDNSDNTNGPHVHLARFNPNPNRDPNLDSNLMLNLPADSRYPQFGGTCDWTMRGVAINNGWVQQNGTWFYYVNDVAQTGWVRFGTRQFFFNDNGAFSGWVWSDVNQSWYFWNGTWWRRQNDNSWVQEVPPA